MKILILNWRDTKNPLGGGAEISLFEHAKYWAKKGASVTWFAASYPNSKEKEIINECNNNTQRFCIIQSIFGHSFIKFKENLVTLTLVVDSFHGLPFLVLYILLGKRYWMINEVAGKLWFLNASFLIARLGYTLRTIFISLYKENTFITGSDSTKEELIKVGLKQI